MGRYTVFEHGVGQHIDDVVASDLSGDVQSQTLARVLIDQHQDFQHVSVVRLLHDEIPAPNMMGILWPQPDAAAIGQPEPPALGLFDRHLQSFAFPDTFDPRSAHGPSLRPHQGMHASVTIAAVLAGQQDHRLCQRGFVAARLRNIANRRSGDVQRPANPSLGMTQVRAHMSHRLATTRRA